MSGVPQGGTPAPARVEQWVVRTCIELGLAVDSAADDFFAAGGTSLTVIRLIARAEAEFGEDSLPPDEVYEHSSLGAIASVIVRNSPDTSGVTPAPGTPPAPAASAGV